MIADYGRVLPEAVLLAGALVALLAGPPLARGRLLTPVGVLTLLAAAAIAVVQSGRTATAFDGEFVIDAPTDVLRVALPLSAAAVLLLGARERRALPRDGETVALLLLSTTGALVLTGADDLLVVVTGYLLTSIPLYGLIGVGRAARAAEAALKTYLLGALFGVVLLGGVAVLAGVGGGTAYPRLEGALPEAPSAAVAIGAVAVVVALLFEAGAVPAHFWTPDAAQAASRGTAAFLTTVPKLAAVVALLRFVAVVQPAVDVGLVVAVVAAASMLLGVLTAFWQDDVRRLLGWSTVGQAGFLLLPVAAAARIGQGAATAPLLIALAGYAVANLAAFAAVAALAARTTIADWRGAARAHPVVTGALLVALLALVGTPPTSVFLGKLAAFRAAWDAGEGWLVVVGAVATVASLFYTLRWVGTAFHAPPGRAPREAAEPLAAVIAVALAVVTVGFAALVPLLAR